MKSISYTFAGVLLTAALTGCASTQNASPEILYDIHEIERTPLTVFTDEISLFPQAAAAFSADSANEAVALTLTLAGEAPAEEVRTLLKSGQTPDLVYLSREADRGVYRALAADEALADLSTFFSSSDAPDLYDGFLDGPSVRAYGDERITGAPMDYTCAGLLVRAGAFPEGTSLPRTLGDFLSLADSMEEGKSLFAFPADHPAYLEPFVLPMLGTAGVNSAGEMRLTTEAFASGAFSSEALQKVAQDLYKLSSSLYTSDPYPDTEAVCKAFAAGETMIVPGDAVLLRTLRESYGLTEDVLLLPAPAVNGTQYLLTAVTPAYIPAAAAHPGEALRFLSLVYRTRAAEGLHPPVRGGAEGLADFKGAVAALFEKGVHAYCGQFAQTGEEGELFESAYTTIGDLVSGRVEAPAWGEAMDQLFKVGETPAA